ncbi:MAG: thioredoxin family protein [Candidatus Tectomicrobia bacterium]|jgi:glutaredoxin 3|nr:thioredoxin family protein [Candidatus Tectomicrobia bacterium]
MNAKRTVEIFSAGCPACEDTIELVNRVACPSCEVTVLDMKQPDVASRARRLGIRSVPAVVINGELADCCTGRGPDEQTLRAAGLGQPLS